MNKEEIKEPKYRPLDFIIFCAINKMIHMGMICYAEYDNYYGWKYVVRLSEEKYTDVEEKDIIKKLNK